MVLNFTFGVMHSLLVSDRNRPEGFFIAQLLHPLHLIHGIRHTTSEALFPTQLSHPFQSSRRTRPGTSAAPVPIPPPHPFRPLRSRVDNPFREMVMKVSGKWG